MEDIIDGEEKSAGGLPTFILKPAILSAPAMLHVVRQDGASSQFLDPAPSTYP